MGIFDSESKRKQQEHNRGQEQGAHETVWDDLFSPRLFESEEHRKGRMNGYKNQPKNKKKDK